MKKLVLLFILAFAFNQTEVIAQSIVLPGEDIIANVIDINATDIVLENRTTGEAHVYNTAAEMYSNWSTINNGRYKIEYNVNEERNKINLNIDNNQLQY
jgi:hypothetical protein